jgi:hypothetical protein
MELIKYKDTLYGKAGDLFIWDSAWETFRPIKKLGWNGSVITHVDMFKEDLLDPWYGFGSLEMKERCRQFTETVDLGTFGTDISKLFTQEEWLRDRKIPLLPCTPRDGKTWARYLNTMGLRRKTVRRECLRKTKKAGHAYPT